MNIFDTAVIGGGAAGLMAAASAAEKGAKVVLIEKMGSTGRKIRISGKGRCNITNTIKDTREFIEHFGKKGKFLYPAVNSFSTSDTVNFFNSLGLATRVEKDFKVFPVSDLAIEVVSTLNNHLKKLNVKVLPGAIIKDIQKNECFSVSLQNDTVFCKTLIIATGGMSYPKTGSTGDGYAYAEKFGHSIVRPVPALTPVVVKENWIGELQGLSLIKTRFSIYKNGKKLTDEINDAVFTENGLSGPAIYELTRKTDVTERDLTLSLDMYPDTEHHILEKKIADTAAANGKKMVKNVLEAFFQPKLLPTAMKICGIDPEMRSGVLSRKQRKELVKIMKDMRLTIDRFEGFEKAVVTAGGVALKEIEGKTMESKLTPGLFFAGEVIDLDGPTGGFNLQMCWSTGRLAGKSAGISALSS